MVSNEGQSMDFISKLGLLGVDFSNIHVEALSQSEFLPLIEIISDEALSLVKANERLQERESEMSEELEHVSSQLRHTLMNNKVKSSKQCTIEVLSTKNNAGKDIDNNIGCFEMKARLLQLETKLTEAMDRAQQDKATIMLIEANNRELGKKVTQYAEHEQQIKGSMTQLENNSDCLMQKLKLQSRTLEERTKQLQSEVSQRIKLNEEMTTLKRDRENLRHCMGSVDAERDTLDNDIEEARNEISNLYLREKNLDNDLSEAQSEVASLRKGAEESQKLLATRDEMLLDLKDKLRYTEENYNDMKGILSAKNNELGRAQYDIAAISRESQMLSQEASRLMTELQNSRTNLNSALDKNTQLEQIRRIAEVEKTDLVKTYRAVVEERFAFEQSNENLRKKLEIITHHSNKIQEEKVLVERNILQMEQEIKKRALNASKFEHQLDNISRKNMSIQRKLEAAEAENRRLKMDLQMSQASTRQISHRAQDLQLTSAKVRDEQASLNSSLLTMKQERDALHKLFSDERHKCQTLELLLGTARAKEAAASDQLKRLAKENAMLTTKINEANSKLANAQMVMAKSYSCSSPDSKTRITCSSRQSSSDKFSQREDDSIAICSIKSPTSLYSPSIVNNSDSNSYSNTQFNPSVGKETSKLSDYLYSPDSTLSNEISPKVQPCENP